MPSRKKDLEISLEQKAVSYAEDRGWMSAKLDKGNKDWPDRGFFGPGGKHFFVEFKRPSESLRPRQNLIRDELLTRGHPVYVISDMVTFTMVSSIEEENTK